MPVAIGPIGDGLATRSALAGIGPGGMTDLAGGYLRGIQEPQRVAADDGASTLVLLSDGHANSRITDHVRLEQFAENGDDAGAALSSEVEGLLIESVQAVRLVVKPSSDVAAVRLFNDLPVSSVEGGFMVELGTSDRPSSDA